MTTFFRRQHPPYIPRGIDHQGRQPEAAQACTDMGVDDDALACASGIVRALLWSLAIWLVGAIAAVAVLWTAGAP